MKLLITAAKVNIVRMEMANSDGTILFGGVFPQNGVVFSRRFGFVCPAGDQNEWREVCGIEGIFLVLQSDSDTCSDGIFSFRRKKMNLFHLNFFAGEIGFDRFLRRRSCAEAL